MTTETKIIDAFMIVNGNGERIHLDVESFHLSAISYTRLQANRALSNIILSYPDAKIVEVEIHQKVSQ